MNTYVARVLVVLLFACAPALARADADRPLFRFGLVADVQYADKETAGPRRYREAAGKLRACLEDLARRDLAFVVSLGDLVDGNGEKTTDELAAMTLLFAWNGVPVRHVIGNHDLALARPALMRALGLRSPYYEFRRAGWRFLVLDGMDVSAQAPASAESAARAREYRDRAPDLPTYNGAVGDRQRAWLKGRLADARRRGEKVVVFCHHPALPAASDRNHTLWNGEEVARMLADAGCVVAYISGHDHRGGYAEQDGVHHLTAPGMVEAPEGANRYAVVEVYADRLEVRGAGAFPDRVLRAPERAGKAAMEDAACVLENRHLRLVIGKDGRTLAFEDRREGVNHAAPGAPFARVKKAGVEYPATAATYADGKLTLAFGDGEFRAVLRPTVSPRFITFEVLEVADRDVQELAFVDIPLTLKGIPGEPFAGCALALNLKTNVAELPGASARLRALCYPRFGFSGAKAALLGSPPGELRKALQDAVAAAPDLPHSPIGGPWALGKKINQGSYLFNFGDMTEEKADDWIKLARTLGMNQIDFHGGSSFRFGDCEPNPQTYPKGRASLKAVIQKLNKAGIQAGLHTYAFFIDKRTPWVTPKPDPRLASDAVFTLAADLPADAQAVPVVEPTQAMSTVTGFFVRNSVTLRIEDELITYTGVSKEPPFAFTGCTRGAHGTRVSAHPRGAKAYHLKECFGLFVPDPETTLFEEVAAKTAETFNECGFSMIYLDALDGEDILGGAENAWHYGSRFVFEIWKRLERPALMEMSTFHHHLWYVRARMGAWDHPTRSHKAFIDLHVKANEDNARMFLPGELGWWAVKTWSGPQGEPTFADDIEYLMAKCLGTDTGFALMGIDPANFGTIPALPRLATIIKRWEDLRHSGKVPEAVRAKLRQPDADYTLENETGGAPRFVPVEYAKHRVEGMDGWSDGWKVANRFERQPLRLRIEALMAAAPYDSPETLALVSAGDPAGFPSRAAAPGVAAEITAEAPSEGREGLRLSVANSGTPARGAWAKWEKTFETPLDLSAKPALGVWVRGDGSGAVLNVQLQSPPHLAAGIGDHYLPLDFTGWRYVALIEPEGRRWADYAWPYGNAYAIYREAVQFGAVSSLSLWLNNVLPGQTVSCAVGPVRALPLAKTKLVNPAVTIGGQTIVFPVEMESGSYLELNGPGDCKLYGPQGELLREVTPQGALPALEPGDNAVTFHCGSPAGVPPRAYVTVITRGSPFPAR